MPVLDGYYFIAVLALTMVKTFKSLNLHATPEEIYLDRRSLLKTLGYAGLVASTGPAVACRQAEAGVAAADVLAPGIIRPEVLKRFPAPRNADYNIKQTLTDPLVAGTHNNFYEFRPGSAGDLWRLTKDFVTDPWKIEVAGACHKPGKFDIDDLMSIDQEERTYRFRCVEAWAMNVPWTGFEFNKLLAKVEPLSTARFVRFTTANRPEQMPGMRQSPQYPWPYFEALRMDEAMNHLTLLATGIYGKPLPRQHGAPFRIIAPWKYGYKSPKSIVKIELLERQPKTFWETLAPREYGFLSNVDPAVPHPRWSQAQERLLGTSRTRSTLVYNGYGEHVAHMYKT